MNFYPLNHEATKEDLKQFHFPNQKIGVIVQIEKQNGEILLQQRGIKSRDENGLYEHIGGKVEDTDITFQSAILREIQEEAGKNLQLNLLPSIGILHSQKKDTNWIFIIYLAKYLSGTFEIMEPEKCMGYRFFSYEEAIQSNFLSTTCQYLIKRIQNYKKCTKTNLS